MPGDPAIFVRARAADAEGAADLAAAGYAQALAAAPDDAVIARRAYRQALAAGDYTLASRSAAVLVRAGNAPPDTAILALGLALRAGDAAGAGRAVDRIAHGPFDFLAPPLRAWLAFDRGEDAVAQLDAEPPNALARRYTARHRALLLIAAHRRDEALVALAPLLATGDAADLRIDAAQLLARTGDRKAARKLLDAAGEGAWAKRLVKGAKPGASFGAARLFLDLAAEIGEEDMADLSIVLARAALLLDPEEDRARLHLASALSVHGSSALALAELAAVDRKSAASHAAGAVEIAALRSAGRLPEALERARALAERRGATRDDFETYGDVLAESGDQAGAARAYAAALARSGDGSEWRLHYLQGRALDRSGQWEDARAALRRAVALGPDQADALSYLGTAEIERGGDLVEAQTLLERAARVEPEDPHVADSLAWAYFQRGDAARALPLLERAVQGDPAGARANEHLGDVYWRLGRHYEARYAWRAAAVQAEGDAAARLQAKLAGGAEARP
ncbi:MAG: tetratricopeptide repeat protein [Sphingomonas sp.]|uniref:tetratricopeptide repeat protein n=1 Tax=Sphingomonas sp. TaxID=28214 RepID=UPI001B1CF040|nr:tetratricopeptide repeat protein [Sphingomonas sp.]MBO9623270.1 tetratricopeptide repeat protein [Sphingomonas sp.]